MAANCCDNDRQEQWSVAIVIAPSSLGLEPAAQFFLLEPAFPGAAAGLCPVPYFIPVQCPAEEKGKALQHLFPVCPLTASLVGMELQDSLPVDPGSQPFPDQGLLLCGEARRAVHGKAEGHPGVDLVHVLATAAGAAGKGKRDLGERNTDTGNDMAPLPAVCALLPCSGFFHLLHHSDHTTE